MNFQVTIFVFHFANNDQVVSWFNDKIISVIFVLAKEEEIELEYKLLSKQRFFKCFSAKTNTVEPRYLELGYLEQLAISNRLPFTLVFL